MPIRPSGLSSAIRYPISEYLRQPTVAPQRILRYRFVSLVAAVLALLMCTGDQPGPPTGYVDLPADRVLIAARHTLTTNGVRVAVGVYDTVLIFNDSSTTQLRGVSLTTYDSFGGAAATVHARQGLLNTVTEEMVAIGEVVVVSTAGRRIETEVLHYNPATGQMWSDKPTKYTFDGRTHYGSSFRSDASFNRVELTDPHGDLPGIRIRR